MTNTPSLLWRTFRILPWSVEEGEDIVKGVEDLDVGWNRCRDTGNGNAPDGVDSIAEGSVPDG